MQMPGNYPKAWRVEAHRMEIEQAGRETEMNQMPGSRLVMQDDWGVLGACVYVDVGRRKARRDKKGDERRRHGWFHIHTERGHRVSANFFPGICPTPHHLQQMINKAQWHRTEGCAFNLGEYLW